MKEIINLLPILGTAMGLNILFGVYNSFVKDTLNFDKKKFIQGILKALVVGFGFIGTSYCFECSDLSSIGVTPEMIMNSAIILYMTKFMNNFAKVLGIDISTLIKK